MANKPVGINVLILRLLVTILGLLSMAFTGEAGASVACQDRISVAAVGDILVHDALQVDAHRSSDRFYSLWKAMTPYISAADISYGNLESPVAMGITADGDDVGDIGFTYDRKVYSGTNMKFNFHPSVISDLQKLGIDIVSTANNHSLDRKSVGIDRTIDELARQNLFFTGLKKSDGQGAWGAVTQVKGKKIFWLSCTEHLNGHRDERNQVLKCFANEGEISKIVQSAVRDYDAVILLPHWGKEYSEEPNAKQKQWAQKMAQLGVTAIIGNHPHVLQPIERIGKTLVAYSLGNFVAWQKDVERKTSVVLYLDLRPDEAGKMQVHSYKGLPTFRVAQSILPGVQKISSAALNYISKHIGAENVVMGSKLSQALSCE